MNSIDLFLNRMTTYRLVLMSLWVLFGVALIETFLNWNDYTPIDLIFSIVLLIVTVRVTSALCSLFTHATPSPESATITALLLFFILSPLQSAGDAVLIICTAALAILSKYIFSYKKKSLFNAAAFGAFVLSLTGSTLVSWWVASIVLLPFVLILGFLVLRKTRQEKIFWVFLVGALVIAIVRAAINDSSAISALSALITISPLVFVGAFMLTDPHTMPASEKQRSIYAFITGCLFSLSATVGPIAASPELALLVGNAYAFFFGKRKRISISFHEVTRLSRGIHEFSFVLTSAFRFRPGQYIEITSPHKSDKRGTRRFFAITSSPSDHFVRVATNMPIERSTFKNTLRELTKGTELSVTGPYGSFVFPHDPNKKILALAGGVGIAPFMSMFRHLAARHERRDMVLIYTAHTPLDFAYQNEIESFKDSIGLRVIYLPTDFSELTGWEGPMGYVTEAFIENEVRDFKRRLWYIAGSGSSVKNHKTLARKIGISKKFLRTESF